MDILGFLTAGSVDDGKSTLIGRLLYDSKNILIDQLEALEKNNKNDDGDVDLALLTDGLRAEREQGITIDVAYKYFSTPKRKFIIADAPGHIQYTRNMVTGASNCDLIIILVDARNGIIEQTKRHSIIASLLQIPNAIVAINKMDLVNYSEQVYDNIKAQYIQMANSLSIKNIDFIPISALKGDNIVDASQNMVWYNGETLLQKLENVQINNAQKSLSRLPVQMVLRPQTAELPDYRGYAGRIESGTFSVGDSVLINPSGLLAKITKIEVNNADVTSASATQSVVIHIDKDIDISRGDLISTPDTSLKTSQDITATICWMDEKPLKVGGKYYIQHNSKLTMAIVKSINFKTDVNTLQKSQNSTDVLLNEIANISIKTSEPLSYDPYNCLRENGGAILIDMNNFVTVAAVLFE